MNDQDRRRRRLWSVPALLFTLLLTTGWTQPAPSAGQPTAPSLGRASDDFAPAGLHVETLLGGSQIRDQHPQRTFAAQVVVAKAPVAKAPVAKAPVAKPVTAAPKRAYTGRNHFWFPSLGISKQVYSYPCSRTTTPANLIYRWGCAGANNVYLLGHAYGVMKPLHDAYVSGRLHVGMIALYADANGRVRSFRVTTWQVVRPTVVSWAIASQPVPSMTLQTCIGALSQWRLDVRLVAVN
jgi:hypothetical protein